MAYIDIIAHGIVAVTLAARRATLHLSSNVTLLTGPIDAPH